MFKSLLVDVFRLYEFLETYCLCPVFDSNTMDIVHEIAQYYQGMRENGTKVGFVHLGIHAFVCVK